MPIPPSSNAPGLSKLQANALGGRWRLFGLSGVNDITTGTVGYANAGYTFVVSGVSVYPTFGATYTNNGQTFTIIAGASGKVYGFQVTPTNIPQTSGTLTKASGTGDATITFSSFLVGTGQNTCTDRVQWTQAFPVLDPMFLFVNGYWTASQLLPVGNPLTIKPYIEFSGQRIALSLKNATTTNISTPAQTGSTTTVSSGSNSIYQALGSTTYLVPGATLYFNSAATASVVRTVPNSTSVILSSAVNTSTNEVVTVSSWPGPSYVIPDGGFCWTEHCMGLFLNTGSYQIATYQSVGPQQVIAKVWGYNYLSTQRSSDTLWGGTKDGGDYTLSTSLIPGFASSAAYYYGPSAAVGRQVGTPLAVTIVMGDSIAFGNGNLPWAGLIGTAIQNAGLSQFNMGLGGATAVNLSKFGGGIIFSLCQYADHIAVSLGTNDIAAAFTISALQAGYLSIAQQTTAYGADISFLSIPPRTTSTDNWVTYANQTPMTYTPQIVAVNNWFRDTSVNGATTYFNNNLNTPGSYSGYFMDICQIIAKGSSGQTPTFTATTFAFTISAPTTAPSFLATYQDANGNVYTVGPSITGETTLYTTILVVPTNLPAASGTLTRVSGTGDNTITYTSYTQSSANQEMYGTGGYWITNGTSNYATADGIHPSSNINSLVAPAVTGTGNPFANLNTTILSSIHP